MVRKYDGKQVACKMCGMVFYAAGWRLQSNRGKFCSKPCADKYRSAHLTGDAAANWRGGDQALMGDYICEVCDVHFKRRYAQKTCSLRCRNILTSLRTGDKHPNWTGGFPKCKDCGRQLGDYHSVYCNEHARVGNRAPRWKGGITPENKRLRHNNAYKNWREEVFIRDDYTCQGCGIRGVYLHADHIKPFALFPDLRLDIDNGQTLCVGCHKSKTRHDWDNYDFHGGKNV